LPAAIAAGIEETRVLQETGFLVSGLGFVLNDAVFLPQMNADKCR
jgi:hypothetical protein